MQLRRTVLVGRRRSWRSRCRRRPRPTRRAGSRTRRTPGRSYPTRPFFGDTHLHTSFSMDAGAFGARLGPRDAYRFARGEEIMASSGQPVKLSRPLDFLVVADHSDNMGFFPISSPASPTCSPIRQGKRWYDMIQAGKGSEAALEHHRRLRAGHDPEGALLRAGHAGLPGRLAGDDQGRRGGQRARPLHRVHRLRVDLEHRRQQPAPQRHLPRRRRQGRARSSPTPTYPPLGSDNPRDLWKWMDAYEDEDRRPACSRIAHNGNLSNGRMFPLIESFTGKPIDREYAETAREVGAALRSSRRSRATARRIRSCRRTTSSPTSRAGTRATSTAAWPRRKEMLEFEYARSALKNGLELEAKLGTNPYKFGLVGSTRRAHRARGGGGGQLLRQDDAAGAEPGARSQRPFIDNPKTGVTIMDWEVGAVRLRRRLGDGEHARGDLFDAMQRTRDLRDHRPAHDRALLRRLGLRRPPTRRTACPAASATRKGVPMGGDLAQAPAGKAPTFLVAALKDPIGANLDRIQIVKGWLDAKGALHEKVYDVAWSERTASPARTASCRRSATRSTSRTRPGPTRSARPS